MVSSISTCLLKSSSLLLLKSTSAISFISSDTILSIVLSEIFQLHLMLCSVCLVAYLIIVRKIEEKSILNFSKKKQSFLNK